MDDETHRSADRTDGRTDGRTDEERIVEWHEALLAGRSEVCDDVADWVLPRLGALLQHAFRGVDPALVQEAAEEGLLRYFKRPAIWRPSRSGLLTFLTAVARRRLLTLLSTRSRQERVEHTFAAEQNASTRPSFDDEPPRIPARVRRQIARTPRERSFLAALLDGERRTAEYARILGIAELPVARQRQEVKRFRDRLVIRARRARG